MIEITQGLPHPNCTTCHGTGWQEVINTITTVTKDSHTYYQQIIQPCHCTTSLGAKDLKITVVEEDVF